MIMLPIWKEKVTGIALSRSRPYHKDDNRFVEQKNATLVRRYLGDVRLDTIAQTRKLNQLYAKMRLFYNFFQPVMRLVGKEFSSRNGRSHLKRRFDAPKTPFERLCASQVLSPADQQALTDWRNQTNPRRLRLEIYALLDQLLRMPGAAPDEVEDVMLSLLTPVPATTTV